jgi:hypothetical protein
VYLPDTARQTKPLGGALPDNLANLYNRLQYAGQFWIGVAAWPAIWQYATFEKKPDGKKPDAYPFIRNFERAPDDEEELNKLQREGDKTWDLGWMYTVIAGVLNILVIYDAFAGPAFNESELAQRQEPEEVGGE